VPPKVKSAGGFKPDTDCMAATVAGMWLYVDSYEEMAWTISAICFLAVVICALRLMRLIAGRSIAARIAMMAMTTSSSTSVKRLRHRRSSEEEGHVGLQRA